MAAPQLLQFIRSHPNALRLFFGTVPAFPTQEGNVADKQTQQRADESNTIKNPDDWTTGDEPMTGAQRSYLHTLAEEARVEVDDDLTKAEASKKIDELQEVTGRGK
jgi:hypothetical protein